MQDAGNYLCYSEHQLWTPLVYHLICTLMEWFKRLVQASESNKCTLIRVVTIAKCQLDTEWHFLRLSKFQRRRKFSHHFYPRNQWHFILNYHTDWLKTKHQQFTSRTCEQKLKRHLQGNVWIDKCWNECSDSRTSELHKRPYQPH